MKYNIIGDIHGRTSWKNLVIEDGVNIFIGDYFDPYDRILFDDLVSNFMDIIMFKASHPDTVILMGNHDYCTYYLRTEKYSRFNGTHANDYRNVFTENKDMLNGFAYNIGNKYFITHAGVTENWKEHRLPKELNVDNLDEVKNAINSLFGQNTPFSFNDNSDWSDCYGESLQQSPLWIRPTSLIQANLWSGKDVVQIVGHTQVTNINKVGEVIFIDVLGGATKSLIIESNEDGSYNEYIQSVTINEDNTIDKKLIQL